MRATIIHISDLHFHSYPQKFSDCNAKRILGLANLFARRAREFPIKRAKLLVEKNPENGLGPPSNQRRHYAAFIGKRVLPGKRNPGSAACKN